MKDGFKADKAILALQRAIVSTFDDGRWQELGYVLGEHEAIVRHPRLLRSLHWGDPDYGGCVFDILPQLLGHDLGNLEAIEDFVGLQNWLKANQPALYAELYEDDNEASEVHPVVPLDQCEQVGEIHSVPELGRHAARIRSGLEDGRDPELAIGSAKELLESVLKTVTGDHEQKPVDNIQILLKKAQAELDLDPKGMDAARPGAESLRRTLSNLGQVVIGVAELRNLYGTGHGRSKSLELELAHARLVVNAAISIATFLLEVWQEKMS
jgi:hypothetical protein